MSHTDLIERVAQAMAESTNGGRYHDGRWYSDEHRRLWRQRAEAGYAVIEAWMAQPPAGTANQPLEPHPIGNTQRSVP